MTIQPGTPLPWEAHQGVCEDQPTVWDITSKAGGWSPCDLTPEGYFVATVHETLDSEAARKDSAYIVHACNTFPELVEALDFMFNVSLLTPGFSAMARKQAERALSKARGQA